MIETLLNKRNLNLAYKRVYSNKGAGGVDGMSVTDLKQHLQQYGEHLQAQIRTGSYQPSPIKGVEIPKSNGKTRLLGVPTATDRVFQQALHQVLEPLFELDFQPHSYGFRPQHDRAIPKGRCPQVASKRWNRKAAGLGYQAVEQAQRYINEGYGYVVDIDLKSFFDEVAHAILLELVYQKVKCSGVMKLLRSFLRAPILINGRLQKRRKGLPQGSPLSPLSQYSAILINGRLQKRRKGLPQGSPLSPLLSNILNELDKELEKRGHRYVRYADDFSIYVRSKKSAQRSGNSIFKYLRDKLNLAINRKKSGIRRPLQFELLGYGFVSRYKKGERGKYQLVVGKKKWEKLKAKLKELTRKTNPMSLDERIQRLNWLIRGWVNYFKLASIHAKLKAIDEWLRNRLRYCIWHHWMTERIRRMNVRWTFK